MANPIAEHGPDGDAPAGGGAPTPPVGPDPEQPTERTEQAVKTDPAEPDQRLLRAMTDLDNMRKRFHREVAREREAERSRVALEWLPVLDDLDRALDHVADDRQDGLATGLRAVRDHALDVLTRLGFPRFDDAGGRFDPARHEAIGAIESDVPAGTIVEVVRPGYGSADVILRPAAVVVARS